MCIQIYQENMERLWDTKNSQVPLGESYNITKPEDCPQETSPRLLWRTSLRAALVWVLLAGCACPIKYKTAEQTSLTHRQRQQLKMNLNDLNPLLVSMQILSLYFSKIFCRKQCLNSKERQNLQPKAEGPAAFSTSTFCCLGDVLAKFTWIYTSTGMVIHQIHIFLSV